MNSELIQINLIKVSGDSNKLYMIYEIPEDYCMTGLKLEARYIDYDGTLKTKLFDMSHVFNNNYGYPLRTTDRKKWYMEIPLTLLGLGAKHAAVYIVTLEAKGKLQDAHTISVPTGWYQGYWYDNVKEGNTVSFNVHLLESDFFTVEEGYRWDEDSQQWGYLFVTPGQTDFNIVEVFDDGDVESFIKLKFVGKNKNGETVEKVTEDMIYYIEEDEDHKNETINPTVKYAILPEDALVITDRGIISDVNNIYRNLVDAIINPGERCLAISDEAIRNYIILYAHQLALTQDQLDDAMLYFRMINSNFNNCGGFNRPDRPHINMCNCIGPNPPRPPRGGCNCH